MKLTTPPACSWRSPGHHRQLTSGAAAKLWQQESNLRAVPGSYDCPGTSRPTPCSSIIFASRTLLEVLPEGAEKEAIQQAQRSDRALAGGGGHGTHAWSGRWLDIRQRPCADARYILKLVNDPEATEISHLRDRLVAAGVSLEAPADWTEQ